MKKKSLWRGHSFSAGMVVAALLAGSTVTPAGTAAAERTAQCRDVTVNARLNGSTPVVVHGRYCAPPRTTARRPVQVLVPGATYNSGYWDYQGGYPEFSYVAHANRAGFPTLALDRVGTGGSSKPPSVLLTTFTQAEVLHQVVQQLRRGRVSGTAHEKIVLVGHSLGSAIVDVEAATHHDVDGVVLTGATHRPRLMVIAEALLRDIRPASTFPAFAGRDPGYLTTIPGHRSELFHSGLSTPSATKQDERTKDAFAVTELVDAGVSLSLPYSRLIDVPVLMPIGDADGVFCGGVLGRTCRDAAALREEEAINFRPEAKLETYVLPHAGHALNLMPNADLYMDAVQRWIARMVR